MRQALEGKKVAVTNEIYAIVKNQIITMQLLPGQLLLAQRISEENGISRTPVREALVRLREENLLEDAGGHKFRVSEITWKLINDLYDARIAIEPFALSSVAGTITKSQVNALKKLVHAMENCYACQDFSGFFEYDMEFHNKILDFLGNQVIKNWMIRILDQQQRIRYLTLGSESRMKNSLAEHRAIAECLERHDAQSASDAMIAHLELSRQNVLRLKEQDHSVASRTIKNQ